MKKIFSFLLLLFLFISCYQEHKEDVRVPDKLMTEEELVNTLTDLQLAEGVLTYQRLQKVGGDKEFKDSIYQVVFEHYGITLEELTENLDYYNSDPQNMELLYDKILTKLSKIQSEVELAAKKDTIQQNPKAEE